MVRKIVNILGILCLVLVLAAGGAAGYLAIKGTLTSASLKTAMAAVTSRPVEAAAAQAAASRPQGKDDEDATSEASEPEAATVGKLEMLRRDLANEQSLLAAGRVSLQRQQEQFEVARKQWESSRQKDQTVAPQAGMQKELDYLSSIKPAQALEMLRGKTDDQASRILMAMETRKGKKIIEMCKSADEKEWIKRILEQIRLQNNVQAQALTGG